jgi:pimeloyl-ACP methyl ester carboxylesterase
MDMERGLVKTSAGYMHYRATGQGKPIILMHANQRSSALYLELMTVLGKGLRVFAIDHPSHGMSDHVTGQPTMADYARYVTEVMDGLQVPQASFLGESFSAAIAVELANTYAARVDKIVLVNCPFWQAHEQDTHSQALMGLRDQRPSDATDFPTTRTLEFVLERDPEHAPLHPTQTWMDRINVAQIEAGRERWQALNALANYDMPANLERLQCPVLLIWGEHFLYLKFRDEFTRRIKHHQALVIQGGRFCLPWEYPDAVGQATLDFVA